MNIDNESNLPLSNKWKLVKNKLGISPYERSKHTCVVIKDELYFYGGLDTTGNSLNDLLVYSDRLGWSYGSVNKITSTINKTVFVEHGFTYHPPAPLEISSIPQGRSFHTSVLYKKFMIVFGGNVTEIDGQVYFLDFSDEAKLTWSVFTAPNAPPEVKTQRFKHSAVIWDNKMVVYGGTNGDSLLPPCILYLDLIKFKWNVKKAECLRPTYGHSAFVKDNMMFVVGGYNNACPNGFSIYTLDTLQSVAVSNYIPSDLYVDRILYKL